MFILYCKLSVVCMYVYLKSPKQNFHSLHIIFKYLGYLVTLKRSDFFFYWYFLFSILIL